MRPIEHILFTILYILFVFGLIYAILKDTTFLKSGFRYKNFFFMPCFLLSSCFCEYPSVVSVADENTNDAPVKALMDYHYGVKNQDTTRFKKAIFDYHPHHINVAMLIFQGDTDCDIVWEHDSFVGKDSVWVYYREINTLWGNTLHRRLFQRYKGRWARKIGYD